MKLLRKLQPILILMLAVVGWYCGAEAPPSEQEAELQVRTSLPDNKAGDIVRQAIDYAGGWEQWAGKKTFSFFKVITHYDSSRTEKRSLRQLHQYQLTPSFKARMSWEKDGDQYLIINNGQQAWKYRNGELLTDQASQDDAWNSSFGSNYVISMPFKLTDPGVILTYDGKDTLTDGRVVEAVKVEYEKGAGSSGGMHVWWYYFDPGTKDLVANFLDHGDGFSYTTYETFTTVGGIRIHEKRNSYMADAAKEPINLQTVYQNESMQFDAPLTDDLFEPLH